MMKYYFLINSFSFLFIFILLFFSVSYKNVIFMVNFTNSSSEGNLIIKDYRQFLFKMTVLFFSLSLVLNNYIYFGMINFLYFSVMVFKFINCHKKVKNLALSENKITKNNDRFLFLNCYDLSLSFFLTLYNFYVIFDKRLGENILFSKTLYIIPLTLFYLNIFAFFTIKLINSGSDFKVKEIKSHIVNILILISYTISISFIIYSEYAVKLITFTALINSLMPVVLSALYIVIYARYIKSINQKFEFNVECEKITAGKVIEVNLTGTKLFINFKNKKSYLLLTGFLLFILSYILFVFLLIK